MGSPLVADVGRRAADVAAAGSHGRRVLWLVRLTASLLTNALVAWAEGLMPSRRGAPFRRDRRDRIMREAPTTLEGPRASRFSWLDVKLGVRMLLKHPGLSLAGGLGIAVAIGVSTGFFAFMYAMIYPSLPLDEGHRLVALENWDVERNNEERRSLHDFVLWREEMRSVEDMSAFWTVSRNLSAGDAMPELVRVAEMTPSGFELARVPPFMGRTLVEADGEPGAPDVLVIGYDVWRTRFAADPGVVGRDVRLGRVTHTIVGVMPEDFAFPLSHSYWIPFREDPADYPRGTGSSIFISGRLAPGYELVDAKAELAVIGERMAAEFPDTHARFRAQVMPYVYPLVDINGNAGEDLFGDFVSINGTIGLLLVLVGLDVAVLIYARTATRRGEMAVRTALGASRGRIVGQLFTESLVLSSVAAVVGLGLAKVGLGLGNEIMKSEMDELPFWLDMGIPGPALAYVVALTLLVATITGVLPGLQATGKRVQENLRRTHSGAGLGLGRTWTTLIVVQVAATVVGLPLAVATGWEEIARGRSLPTYDADRFLTAWVVTDEEGLAADEVEEYRRTTAGHLADVRSELIRRIEAEPGVAAHAPIVDLPGSGTRVRVAVEGVAGMAASAGPRQARRTRVHPEFFPTFDVQLVAGRPIVAGDLDEGARDVAVVDRTFVRHVIGGGEALGRRIRFVTSDAPTPEAEATERWYEIVGVTENQHENRIDPDRLDPVVYLPSTATFQHTREAEPDEEGIAVAIETAGIDPVDLAGRVRAVMAEIDPTLRVSTLPLADVYRQQQFALVLVAFMLLAVIASVLLLSAAGIYALMSFTVSQRRREIGIRTALGAQRRRLLGGIFSRALGQLGTGVLLGVGAALVLDWRLGGEALRGQGPVLLSVMVVVMTAVGLLAAVGPARRGLGVAPAESLQAE